MKHKTAFYAALALAATAWILNANAGPTRFAPDAQKDVARAVRAAAAANGLPTSAPAVQAPAPQEPEAAPLQTAPALAMPAPAKPAQALPCLAQVGPSGEALIQAPGQPIEAGCSGE